MKDKEREKEVLDELRDITIGIEEEFMRIAVDAPLSIERENLKAGRRSRKAARRMLLLLKRYIALSIEKDRDYFHKTRRQLEREALGLPIRPDNSKHLITFKGIPKQDRKEYARKLREQREQEQTKDENDGGGTIS